MPAFLIEGCLSIYLKNAVIEKDYTDGMPVAMRPCLEIMKLYVDLFRNETFFSHELTQKKLLESVGFFVNKGLLKIEGDNVIVLNREGMFKLIDFFANLLQPLIDTYLVTLTALYEMCGKNLVIKNKKLTKELHSSLKQLYAQNVIPHLHSCLREIIQTAIERYEKMGFVEMRAYATKQGNSSLYLTSPAESKKKINDLWELIT